MTAETDRERRVKAIERRLGGAQAVVEDVPAAPERGAAPARGKRKTGRFPGAGRSISGNAGDAGSEAEADDGDEDGAEDGNEDNVESEAASDFDDDFQDEDDDDGDDDDDGGDYSSSGEQRAPRGGLGKYNLRAPSTKRKHSAGGDFSASDSDEGGPALRRRTRTAVNYSENAVSDSDSGGADGGSGDDA